MFLKLLVTSAVCKLMEKIANVRLASKTLNRTNFITNYQFGYRKGKSTIDNLIKFQTDILESFKRKEQLVAVFFDLEKAFDTTWKHGILKVIHELGFRGPLAKFIRNFLSERKFISKIGSQSSGEHDLEQGVPQGQSAVWKICA